MPGIYTEIAIDATPEEVWDVLVDFERYEEWNPFIHYAGGDSRLGGTLQVRLTPPKGPGFSVKPKVVARDENVLFSWQGRLWMPGIFDGRHSFEIEERDGSVVFKHYEKFAGLLAFPMGWMGVYSKTKAGFEEMNQALKKRVESGKTEGE